MYRLMILYISTSLHQIIKKIDAGLFFAGVFIFAFIGLKAWYTAITWDEAFTFLNYVISRDVFSTEFANNHPLNTALIIASTVASENILFIRLPNILMSLMYIFCAYLLSIKSQHKFFSFFVLMSCPYLIDFFSLARGYGIAAALISIAFALYLKCGDMREKYIYPILLLLVSCYAYYPSVVLLFIFVVFFVFDQWNNLSRLQMFVTIILIIAIASFPIFAMQQVSKVGKPIYGESNYSIVDIILGSFGFEKLFDPFNNLLGKITFFLVLLPIFFYSKLSNKTQSVIKILLIFLIVYFGAAFLSGRPLPTHRLLVPFVPLLLITSKFSYEEVFTLLPKNNISVFINMLTLILVINLFATVQLNDTFDWNENKIDPNEAIKISINNGKCSYLGVFHPSKDYYIRQQILGGKSYCDAFNGVVIGGNK